MSRESVLEALREDHRRLLALTEALARAVSSLGEADRGELADRVQDCQEQLWGLRQAFVAHRCREEVGLFPDVERRFFYGAPRMDALGEFFAGEAEDDIRAHLAVENQLKRMAGLTESLRSSGAAGEEVLSELRALVGKTKDLIARHASKEDQVLFPMMVRLLSDEQVAAVATRLRDLSSDMDDSGD